MHYKINKDETIAHIIDFFDTPFHLIQRYNPWVSNKDTCYEGRTLTLPIKFTVMPDHSYEKIATQFGLTKEEFWELNRDIQHAAVIYQGGTVFLPPQRTEKIPDKKPTKLRGAFTQYEYQQLSPYGPGAAYIQPYPTNEAFRMPVSPQPYPYYYPVYPYYIRKP